MKNNQKSLTAAPEMKWGMESNHSDLFLKQNRKLKI